jgi:hypothetical protein
VAIGGKAVILPSLPFLGTVSGAEQNHNYTSKVTDRLSGHRQIKNQIQGRRIKVISQKEKKRNGDRRVAKMEIKGRKTETEPLMDAQTETVRHHQRRRECGLPRTVRSLAGFV